MANKKKLQLGPIQANKFIAEVLEHRENIAAQVNFRHYFLESQKRVSYQNEVDRLQGAKRIIGLQPNAKPRMKELQQKNKTIAKNRNPCYL